MKTKEKNIVFFTGAGVSAESGVPTFRSGASPLWGGVKVEDVATPKGWEANPERVLNFYNDRRSELPDVEPNSAHRAMVEAEKLFKEVTIITQNVDDLHERAGSTEILHLHGELTKARGCEHDFMNETYLVRDIGYEPIKMGDTCDNGSQLRPHIVWFEEFPFEIPQAEKALKEADYIVIVGTSLQIGYTVPMIALTAKEDAVIYYVDPDPVRVLDAYHPVKYVLEPATKGVPYVIKEITESLNEE